MNLSRVPGRWAIGMIIVGILTATFDPLLGGLLVGYALGRLK